ncbi:hypothetical protein M3Y98_00675400 [Aphelenchoides besseyi]|nr:hypothetical protein M3Y98_00675400 [Aphelenchoides besseyi]
MKSQAIVRSHLTDMLELYVGLAKTRTKFTWIKLAFTFNIPCWTKWSPPGTQFICSLDFHINWTLKGPKCEFFFSNFIQWTPEDLKFIGCKWPIVNDGGIETFRKLSMDSGPNFKTYENRPFNRMCARYLEQMPGRPEDERLFEGRSFARIMLWMNSPSRLTKLGIDSSRKLKYKIGKWYCVSVVSSRLDHRIWEIRSKKSIKMYGPIATEYLDQMDAFYRALEPDAYYVPTYRYANKPTPYVIECIQLTDRRLIAIRMVSRLVLVLNLAFIGHVLAQTDEPKQTVCAQNQLFNGEMCTCAPGYFASTNNESMARCEDECEEVYFSFFTYGTCAKGLFDKRPKSDRAFCDTVCGVRLRLWTSIGIFCVFAAAIATLVFTLPLCIATCTSCIHSRKASKHSKRVYNETQAAPSKDQQLQAVSPYYGHQYAASYWPYYHAGR